MSQAGEKCLEAKRLEVLNVLLVGEGNLSFTYALVKKLSRSRLFRRWKREEDNTTEEAVGATTTVPRYVCDVLATTFDPATELVCKYPEAVPFLDYFASKQRVHIHYRGGVNATDLQRTLPKDTAMREFHLLFFNNPHIGFEDLYRQRALLSHFFASARALPRQSGASLPLQVVVTLCDDQPSRWGLLRAAQRSGFACVAGIPLFPTEYPEFTNRRHQSGSQFPYKAMVEYVFMPLEDCVQTMRELRQIFTCFYALNDDDLPVATEWQEVCDTLLNDLSGPPCEGAVCTPPSSPGCTSAVVDDASHTKGCSLRALVSSAGVPMPLLHPHIAHYSGESFFVCDGPAPSCVGEKRDHLFSPYIPLPLITVLYRHQMQAERGHSPALSLTDGVEKLLMIPPQLDESCLGRPLTQREEVKLRRFVAKHSRMPARTDVSVGPGTRKYVCEECVPPRFFSVIDDFEQHTRSKHDGATQYHPNMHARVHQQIIGVDFLLRPGALEEAAMSGGTDSYCPECDVLFRTRNDYEEHLAFLSPLPPEGVPAVCALCSPPREFLDERALAQHRRRAHDGG